MGSGIEIGDNSGSNTLRVLDTGIFCNNQKVATRNWVTDQSYVKSVNNVLPDSDGNVDIQGGGGTSEVFIAEYEVTLAQDIFDAIDDGKTVLCKKAFSSGYDYYLLGRYSPSYPGAVFYREDNYNVYSINVYIENNTDVWRASNVTVADNTLSNVSSANIISVLGYTPYNATNPNGYISSITSSDVTTALGYTPVNKAGDTMSGSLTANGITSVNSVENNHNSSVSKGTIPSTTQYRNLSFNDGNTSHTTWQSRRFGLIENQLNTSGDSILTISAYKNEANSSSSATLTLGMPQSGNAYCTFPNTTCVDGQWVTSVSTLASNVALPTTDNLSYDLSNYLPADASTYQYEVLLSGIIYGGNTTGNQSILRVGGETNGIVCQVIARSNASYRTAGSITVATPASHSNIIRVFADSVNTGTFNLSVRGYRRLGTNA